MFKFLKGFLAGLVVGLLFAPQSGAKSRRKISNTLKDYKDEARDYLADAIDTVESKVHSAKTSVQEM